MPLAMGGAFDAGTLEAVIADVVAEGCIGETLAALRDRRGHRAVRESNARIRVSGRSRTAVR
jgi:hypothetical protein